jgi:uncharacterized protein YkwD
MRHHGGVRILLRLIAVVLVLALVLAVTDAWRTAEGPVERADRERVQDPQGEGGVLVASARVDCPAADRLPDRPGDAAFAAAVECLMVAERAARGAGGLSRESRLVAAAQGHSDDMGRRRYFAHDSPEGDSVGDRARSTGFSPRIGRTWRVGENLYYGSGPLGTPRRVVRGWMESPSHRAAILDPAFTQVGVGLALGRPDEHRPPGVLATAVFGDR